MFCFKASSILKELQRYNPELLENCKLSFKHSYPDLSFQRLDEKNLKIA